MKQLKNVSPAITNLPAFENMKREARGSDLVVFVIWALHNPVGVCVIIESVFTISFGNKIPIKCKIETDLICFQKKHINFD